MSDRSEPSRHPDEHPGDWSDTRVDHAIGLILRLGVLLAAAIVLVGAVLYLAQNGMALPHYEVFKDSPANAIDLPRLLRGVGALDGVAIIQLGLLVLIATPMSRVLLAVYAFYRQHDGLYVAVSLIVFVIVLISLFVVR